MGIFFLATAVPARAVTVPLPNSQSEVLTGSLGITGSSASIEGSFPISGTSVDFPAQTVPVSFSAPLKFNSQPDPSSAFVAELSGPFNGSLVTFTNFDIDLLPNTQIPFMADPLFVDAFFLGVPVENTLTVSGSIVGMSFTQTGSPTVFPTRDFTVPGTLSLTFGEFLLDFSAFGAEIGGTNVEVPITLSGTFSGFYVIFQVKGSGSAEVPFAMLETTLVGDPPASFTAGIQGTASTTPSHCSTSSPSRKASHCC
ncbi:MAG: hypothetical protein AB7U73_19160 [Pirellulales bacterium]